MLKENYEAKQSNRILVIPRGTHTHPRTHIKKTNIYMYIFMYVYLHICIYIYNFELFDSRTSRSPILHLCFAEQQCVCREELLDELRSLQIDEKVFQEVLKLPAQEAQSESKDRVCKAGRVLCPATILIDFASFVPMRLSSTCRKCNRGARRFGTCLRTSSAGT